MIINHNLGAMNASRMMGVNQGNAGKSMEKLSSGMRINKAGDDAAGLAISEKMRGQIRGLDQAGANSQAGISLIQTAEGALNETHSILQRMRELSVQAANDTNVGTDRTEIQKEMNQLTSEVNRIGNTTEFNTMKLLNGDRSEGGSVITKKTVVAAMASKSLTSAAGITYTGDGKAPAFADGTTKNQITIDKTADGFAGVTGDDTKITVSKTADDKLTVTIKSGAGAPKAIDITDSMSVSDADGNFNYDDHGVKFTMSGADYKAMGSVGAKTEFELTKIEVLTDGKKVTKNDFVTNTGTTATDAATVTLFKVNQDVEFENMDSMDVQWSTTGKTMTVTMNDKAGKVLVTDTIAATAVGAATAYKSHGVEFTLTTKAGTLTGEFKHTFDKTTKDVTATVADKSLSFQVGANENQAMMLNMNDMRSEALGISSKDVTKAGFALTATVTNGNDNVKAEAGLDVSTHKAAAASVTTIQAAIEKVSSERSKIGAVQNRLEHTIANLGTSSENLTAAESRVRDVDMAKEMSTFSKNNILSQAAQAMLVQANQQPQQVLQLLR